MKYAALVICWYLWKCFAIFRKRGDLYKNITPDYYGYRDDDDGKLEPLEAEREVRKPQRRHTRYNVRTYYCGVWLLWQRELIGEAVREHAQKKQKLADEVRRTGGAFGETKELLQKYVNDELRMNDPDIAAAIAISGVSSTNGEDIVKSHIVLPSEDAIAAALVEQKKKAMLEKYAL